MAIAAPFRVFRYKVVIEGIERAGFSEVSGMNISVDPIEYREGNDIRNTPRKYPGLAKFGNVSLKWGLTDDSAFLTWIQTVAPSNTDGPKGENLRKTVTITLIDDTGKDGPSWSLLNAWPVGYNIPDLSGLGGDIAISSLELCCEGIDFTSGAATTTSNEGGGSGEAQEV